MTSGIRIVRYGAVAVLCVLAFMAGRVAARSGPPPAAPAAAPDEGPAVHAIVRADRKGLLLADGPGVLIEKAAVGDDWRDAARIAPGGFFAARTAVEAGDMLRFAVSGGPAKVTLVDGHGEARVLYEGAPSAAGWTDVECVAGSAGTSVLFEASDAGEALIANPRIVRAERALNVVFVIADALRADRLGVYGYSRSTSPEIDAAAGAGVVFADCQAQAPWTAPSVASIFTSLYPSEHGRVLPLDGRSPGLESVAERFAAAGYITGAVQANPNLSPVHGSADGFHAYIMYPRRDMTDDECARFARADVVTDAGVAWIERHRGEPFFLYLHYMDPHAPYAPAAEFNVFGKAPSDLYDGEVASVSRGFGRLYGYLGREGLLENTVVVLTSDHGEQFYEHGSRDHGNCLHVEELHVPLVIWMPGRASRRVAGPLESIDIAPTLLELAGLPALAEARGISFAGALSGDALPAGAVISELMAFKDAGQHQVSVVEDGYRLIAHMPTDNWRRRVELYSSVADPGEYVNLAAAEPERLAAMLRTARRHVRTASARHEGLVPEPVIIEPSSERVELLRAIGYLSPG